MFSAILMILFCLSSYGLGQISDQVQSQAIDRHFQNEIPSLEILQRRKLLDADLPSWHPRRNRRKKMEQDLEGSKDLKRPDFGEAPVAGAKGVSANGAPKQSRAEKEEKSSTADTTKVKKLVKSGTETAPPPSSSLSPSSDDMAKPTRHSSLDSKGTKEIMGDVEASENLVSSEVSSEKTSSRNAGSKAETSHSTSKHTKERHGSSSISSNGSKELDRSEGSEEMKGSADKAKSIGGLTKGALSAKSTSTSFSSLKSSASSPSFTSSRVRSKSSSSSADADTPGVRRGGRGGLRNGTRTEEVKGSKSPRSASKSAESSSQNSTRPTKVTRPGRPSKELPETIPASHLVGKGERRVAGKKEDLESLHGAVKEKIFPPSLSKIPGAQTAKGSDTTQNLPGEEAAKRVKKERHHADVKVGHKAKAGNDTKHSFVYDAGWHDSEKEKTTVNVTDGGDNEEVGKDTGVDKSEQITSIEDEMQANKMKWATYESGYHGLCDPNGNGTLCPLNVLQGVTAQDVAMSPFPHLVVYDALPEYIYTDLEAAFPSDRVIAHVARGEGKESLKDNFRMDIPAEKSLKSELFHHRLDPFIVDFVTFHTSPAFYQEVVRVLGSAIEEVRKDIRQKNKNLNQFKVSIRGDEDKDTDLKIDCQIGMNSPSKQDGKSVRGPHHDELGSVFAGLLYLRHPQDTSTGGDLQVWGCKHRNCSEVSEEEKAERGMRTKKNHDQFDTHDLNLVATIPYKRNALVFFVNSQKSIHGVTPRSVAPYSRRLINFIGNKASRRDVKKAQRAENK